MSLYSRLDRIAADVEKLNRQVTAVANSPQAQRTSIEAGTMDINDEDGNLISSVGFQEDGSGAVRFFDGPVPPVPSGVTASADGPIIQASWDGSFVDGQEATYDLAYLEVAATLVADASNVSFATITAKEGASASVVADVTGDWVVAVRSVSQAGKKSEFATAGTVEVKLTDVAGAIEAVQDSANGKNKVTYSEHAPTENDPGIFDDTWFVGQVGRPEDIIEATNLAENPSFGSLSSQVGAGAINPGSGVSMSLSTAWSTSGGESLKITPTASNNTTVVDGMIRDNPDTALWAGKTVTISADFHLDTPQTGSTWYNARRIVVRTVVGGVLDSNFAQSNTPSNVAGDQKVSVTFTLPTNLDSWYFMFVNGSSTTPVYWDSVLIQESSTSGAYFDGDTPSGATDNESHYRWTGTPHASTSEKYLPALDIGESSNWNIIEQYRHDGNGWVKVELSHYVFSTVDLGKATVGELDGIRIMGQTIRGEQLSGDAIDGKVITGPTIQSSRDGQRWVGDTAGIRIFNADNEVRTQLSPDGSTFKGEVEADTLVVNGGAELKANNTLAQGAKLTLAAGVTDPTAPPVVQPHWAGVEFTPPSTATPVGLAFDGTHYWTAEAWPRFGAAWKINATTGVAEQVSIPGSWGRVFGVTCIGSELYWLNLVSHKSNVIVTDLNLTKKREFEFEDIGFSPTNPLVYEPGIGNDGTNVLIAHCSDSGTLYLRTYNPSTGAKTATAQVEGFNSDVTGAFRGSADFGLVRTVVSRPTSYQLRVGGTDLAYDGARSWDGPSDAEVAGFCWTGSRFASIGADGKITEYADPNTGDGSGDWWAVYAWAEDWDGNGVTETWSRISPPKRFTWPRRAGIKFIGQPLPDGVQMILPAIAKKTTVPTRTDFHSPGWSFSEGRPVAWYNALPTDWATWASPRDSNNFPEAEKSVIESASATFRVEGDGSGRWGPLTFGADGSMSGMRRMAAGRVSIAVTDQQAGYNTATVQFPTGLFTSPPAVTTGANSTNTALVNVGVLSVTVDQATISVRRTTTTPTVVDWIATEID